MPYKNKEDLRLSNQRSYYKNKEKWKLTRKKYDSQPKRKKYLSEYQKANREKINQRKKERAIVDLEYRNKRNQMSSEWRKKNPEKQIESKKRSILKKKYGLTSEQFDDLLKEHQEVCAICKTKNVRPNNKKGICIDHNHKTGKVRGLLCDKCNRGIGLFGDSKELLEKAIKYIKKYETNA